MSAALPDDAGPLRADTSARPDDPYGDAFAVADRLAVHGSDCVCPPCAGRLPGLLRDLARAMPPVRDTSHHAG